MLSFRAYITKCPTQNCRFTAFKRLLKCFQDDISSFDNLNDVAVLLGLN